MKNKPPSGFLGNTEVNTQEIGSKNNTDVSVSIVFY